ncbi:hypothetical protein G5I_06558 [Acromyrmex echinatior]|uniref:Uncharacterized protein n=1 Tax=Acromyrmex echinatior TaxID=103372 RepID=F4WLD3_ACREC|nr:hypothetical protein G5I_06558 [Acromyrmex echinatior]
MVSDGNVSIPCRLVTATSANCTAVNSAMLAGHSMHGTLRSPYANQNRSGTASEHETKRESGAKHGYASLDEDQQVAWTSGGDRCLYVVGEEGVDVVAWRGYSGRLE